MKTCIMCKKVYDENLDQSEYAKAGEWLAEQIFLDAGKLCPLCLENRARLVMMYGHEINT